MKRHRMKLTVAAAVLAVVAAAAVGWITLSDVWASARAQDLLAQGDACRNLGLWYEAKPCYEGVLAAYPHNGNVAKAKMGLAACSEATFPDDARQLYAEVVA